MSSQNVTSAGVFAYGCPPEPASPTRAIPPLPTGAEQWPAVPFVAFGPCPKCKRHCRENECPFCYADSLKPEAMAEKLAAAEKRYTDALRTIEDVVKERDAIQRELDGLRRDLAKLLAEHGGMP